MGLLNKLLGIEKGIENLTRSLMNIMRDIIHNANTEDELERYMTKSNIHYSKDEEGAIGFIWTYNNEDWIFKYQDNTVTVYNGSSFSQFYPIMLFLSKGEQVIYYQVNQFGKQPDELGQIMLKKLDILGARNIRKS